MIRFSSLTRSRPSFAWSTSIGTLQHVYRPCRLMRRHAIDLNTLNTAWSPNAVDTAASLAPQFFAASLPPYLAFLYIASRPEVKMPKRTLFGFGFLLVFVGATIPGKDWNFAISLWPGMGKKIIPLGWMERH